MAMVFTLASHLREALTEYVQRKVDERNAEENKKKEAELEVSLLYSVETSAQCGEAGRCATTLWKRC